MAGIAGIRSGTSVIISTRDRPRLVAEAVSSILDGQQLPAEVVVIDQSVATNSWFAQVETPPGCRVMYVHSRERGLSRGRNEGIRRASFDRLAFIDDDIVVSDTWLGRIIDALEAEGPSGVVTGRIDIAEGSGSFAPSTILDDAPARHVLPGDRDVLYTNNLAIARSVFDAVGLFDAELGAGTSFPSAEDNDMGYRILRAGYPIVYRPEALVYHRAWRPNRGYVPLRWGYGRGQGAFFAKHVSRGDGFMARRFRRQLGRRARALPLAMLRHPFGSLGAVAFLMGELTGFLQWTALHRRVGREGMGRR